MVDFFYIALTACAGVIIPALFFWWSGACYKPKVFKGELENIWYLFYIEY